MILILGGTTEGRIAARTLEEAGSVYYYSTKGDEQEIVLHHGIRLQGGLNTESMETLCRQNDIRLIVDAAHPFATLLHQTVSEVADKLKIDVIRYERIYPPRSNLQIHWCDDFTDAIAQIQKRGISRLLALTGVQTISKLKPLWEGESSDCYFRILDRESSRRIAAQAGFPAECLRYYAPDEDERVILKELRPQAILTKESGVSGGFKEKTEAALKENILVYAIKRPALPDRFITVNGEHGLRRMIEKLLPEFYPLRSGVSTGTCATAAAVAAIWGMQADSMEVPKEFPVILPNGETIYIAAELTTSSPRIITENNETFAETEAAVRKDAGDDPDITNGMEIRVRVAIPHKPTSHAGASASDDSKQADGDSAKAIEPAVIIRGGEGVGTVTIPGLGLEIGGPAINAAPRKMIEENVRAALRLHKSVSGASPVIVTVSAVGGAEIAQRTFNPRLGIEGGISIIGTSGIVKPFSTTAFINSIRKSMEVARATGSERVVINSGAKSEKFVRAYHADVPAQAFVHYGNFIGETLKIAAELNVPFVTLGIMIGKAVKLAEGYLDTHSKQVTMNKDFLQEVARNVGCNEDTCAEIGNIKLARELWSLLPNRELSLYCKELLRLCHMHCDSLLPNGKLDILLITEEGKIIT